ncbi:hypothetical protein [Prosthecobacter dejongeii]|uniref:Uncharacterized protein n=1 Tax=Prosthecobacter dejongeii TaxID=48465 RepID=A0A7W8DQ25_9BACT|nr:hypothetical protein [Prosthecobacter dejongeii]MBB5037536.1 hypothetical protein [Prosthecobacter dejongeii]
MQSNHKSESEVKVEIDEEKKAQLAALQQDVERVTKTRQSGRALREIHERELYKVLYESWYAYCDNVLDITPQRAHQLMQAANRADYLVKECGFDDAVVPETERALRLLVALPKDQAAKALKAAVQKTGGNRPTFSALAAAINEITGQKPVDKGAKKKIKVIEAADQMFAVLDEAPAEEYSLGSLKKLKKLARTLTSKISALENCEEEDEMRVIVTHGTYENNPVTENSAEV